MLNENELNRFVASIDDRLQTIEEGFRATHEQEGLYERLRKLETFRKRALVVLTTIVGAIITGLIKLLLF